MHRQGPERGAVAVLLDTDPGIDDAVALALAARAPELRLVSVTTSYGNAPLAYTTRNARCVLDLAGRPEVPVLPGSAVPLSGAFAGNPTRHGAEGLGHAVLPAPAPTISRTRSDALLEALRCAELTGPVVLVTLGPLTNLAHAVLADADAVRARIAYHVAVCGDFATGRASTSTGEFNLSADPAAAEQVFAAELPTRVVPIDVTGRVRVSAEEITASRLAADPLTQALGAALAFPGGPDRAVHDAVAVAGVVAPDLLDFTRRRLKIGETGGGELRADIATAVDADGVRRLLGRVLSIG